jgi:hypothetical protein
VTAAVLIFSVALTASPAYSGLAVVLLLVFLALLLGV